MSRSSIYVGDVMDGLSKLNAGSVRTCITSPPYWGLRDYGVDGQLGLEHTPDEYVSNLVDVFREVRRVLCDDGTVWLNIGDTYAAQRGGTVMPAETLGGGVNGWTKDGKRTNRDRNNGYSPSRNASAFGLKHKDLVGIPWRVAFALQADGWYLRQDIIWNKPNPMPESVRDRCTRSHEYVFLLSKGERYFYDNDAIKEQAVTDPGLMRNKRDVWTVPTKSYQGAHFAVMPEGLVEPCVLAGSAVGDLVMDPFAGSGTVGAVATRLQRDFYGIELNPEYAKIATERIGV